MLSRTPCHVYLSRGSLIKVFFAKSLALKKILSRTLKKTFAGSHVGTLAAFVMENLYMDL